MILKFIFILLIVVILSCIYLLFVLFSRYKVLKNDVLKIMLAVKRLRYGDINIRAENLNDKNLENAVNRLIETINDRELMIKEYQNALSKKNLSLEEIIKQEKEIQLFKEEFTATLTHDMKVPVIAELNSINYLLEGRFGILNEKQTEVLNLMKSSNQELKELIENIIETYRLEQKNIELNLTDNNINEFINSLVMEMKPIVSENNHQIVIEKKIPETQNLIFDTFQVKRVIKNLLQNAITFSPKNSKIIIRLEKLQNKIKITISNKGSSISKEDLELIFQKYYTCHSKFKRVSTGLGLYLSKQIIDAHKGTIEADCSKSDETSFSVTIPLNIPS